MDSAQRQRPNAKGMLLLWQTDPSGAEALGAANLSQRSVTDLPILAQLVVQSLRSFCKACS